METQYTVALSPDLGLSPTEFVSAWNSDSEASQSGQARLSTAPNVEYDITLLVGALLSIPAGLATNTLYDLIKAILVKKGVHKQTHIEVLEQPDGTRFLVIDTQE
jgi:hypothetical protein